MKKNLLYSKFLKTCLLVVGLFFTGTIFAQTIGNGQTLNASVAGPNVTIQAGGTLNMDVTKGFTNITTSGSGVSHITGSGTANVGNTVTIGAGNNLEITTAVVATNLVTTLDNNQTATLSGTGNLNAGTVNVGGGNGDDVTLFISGGFTLQGGNINGTGGNGSTNHIVTTSGVLKISGILTGIDAFNANTNSTVEFNGGNNQAVPDYNYYHLTLAGTGAKIFSQPVTITGNFLLEDGAILSLANRDLTINANGNRSATINGRLNINGSGRLTEAGTSTKTLVLGPVGYIYITANTTLPALNAYDFDATSTVEYGAAANQTITDVPSPGYGHLMISGGNTKAAAGNLEIQGNLTISAATFDAANSIVLGSKTHNLKGNWIRNGGVFTAGTGTGGIVFSGTAAQEIGGTQPTTFGNIAFANTGGGITLTRPVTVTGTATFTSGIVASDATNLLIFNDNATSSLIANALNTATTSYVSGPVRKIGDDNFTFPVGKAGTGFVPIRIADISGTTSVFTAEYLRATPPNRTNITAPGITVISKCEYWVLDRAPGTAAEPDVTGFWNTNSPCSAGPYVTQPSSMRLVHYNGTAWDAASTSFGTGSSNFGAVVWINVSSFSPFALGTTSSTENPLPVVFGDVKAYEKNGGVQIEWSNLTEKDVAAYTIERSDNGVDFNAIGQQLPTSNQDDKASYDAFDATPVAGTNYYRIKAAETTGKIVYSKILRVDLGQAGKGLKLYPNPVTGNHITVSLSNIKKGQYNLRVVNTAGQDVVKQIISSSSNALTQTIDLPSTIKPGVYSMLITGADYRESKTFIVQ